MRQMTRLLIGSLVAAYSLVTSPAWPCDTEATATPNSTCVITAREGRRGAWFDLQTADQLRREHEQVPIVVTMLEQYRSLVAVRESQIRSLEAANAERTAASNAATKAVQEARQEALDASTWYRSPLVWGLVGVVLGGTVVAIIAP
jgi:hypothetical protein